LACGSSGSDDATSVAETEGTGSTGRDASAGPSTSPDGDGTTDDDTTTPSTSSAPTTDDDTTGPQGECFAARLLWFEDFETGAYDRWTSKSYGADWGNECQGNGLSREQSRSGSWSNRSEITCVLGESHRG